MAILKVDLADSLNWNRLGTWNLESSDKRAGRIVPIPPVSAVAPSPLVLAACSAPDIPAHWRLGAWCYPFVSVNPGSTAGFVGLGALPRHAVLLDNYALIKCQQFEGVTNYIYQFQPVRYIAEIVIEAWWYDGTTDTDIQEILRSLA